MYRILYHGTDKLAYSRIREGLPKTMRLRVEPNRTRLKSALEDIRPHGIVVPLSDPGPDDLMYLKKVISLPATPGVVVAAYPISAPQAVCCMRLGAYDCLAGPVSGEVLGASLNRMLTNVRADSKERKPPLILGESRPISNLRDRLAEYATMNHPVLITGETGSGKELAARTIHRFSSKSDGPFNAINCATYPEDLLNSELFGSYRGAFTGSVDRPGLFESSRGGTLFLDEIAELSMAGQASLLRAIEEKTIRRMGSLRPVSVDIRIVAATNRPLREMMKENCFRPDLFYRLNLLGVTVPPLRKRREDIPLLARHCLESNERSEHYRLDNRALAALVRYNWPGNVRELQSVLLKASLSARNGVIRSVDIHLG